MKIRNMITQIAIFIIIAVSGSTVFADDVIRVYVNDNQLNFDVDPIIEDGRTLVPLRAIFEALGAEVEWNSETKTAVATCGEDTVSITVDSNVLYKNDVAIELDVSAQIVEERTLVPIRAVSESFDANVEWNGEERTIYILTEKYYNTIYPDESTEALSIVELSEADMRKLLVQKDDIRYNFEQYFLPAETLSDSESVNEILQDEDLLRNIISTIWTVYVERAVIEIQVESETDYTIDHNVIESEGGIEEAYGLILKQAELDADSVIENTVLFKTEQGTRVGVIVFKSANEGLMAQCKYIGIAASESGEVRYFTAECDAFTPDSWFLCEVTKEGRGTLSLLKKMDNAEDELKAFAALAASTYENNQTAVISMSRD